MRNLIKATVKTGGGTLATLILGASAMKVIALILGPQGVGLFSLLRHTQQTATLVGTFGGQTALVQGIASRQGAAKVEYIRAAFVFFLCGAAMIALSLIMMAPWLAAVLLARRDGPGVAIIRWLAVPALFGAAIAFLSGVLNGFRAIGRLALVNVAAAAGMAALAFPLSRMAAAGRPMAVLWLLSCGLGAGLIVALTLVWRGGWLKACVKGWRAPVDRESARHFVRFGGVTLVTSLAQMGTVLGIRAAIVHKTGLDGAGIFDVAWTISMTYVMLALTSFGTYYLPALSGLSERDARQTLMNQMLRFTVVVMVPLVTAVIVLRPLVVALLYSERFLQALPIMRWTLIGDYVKAVSWVFAMPMLAYMDMKRFFWSEILSNVFFGLFCVASLRWRGADMQWLGVGFLLVYCGYLCYVVAYVHRRLAIVIPRETVLACSAGGLVVLVASAVAWNATRINWLLSASAIVGASLCSLTLLKSEERRALLGKLRGGGGNTWA